MRDARCAIRLFAFVALRLGIDARRSLFLRVFERGALHRTASGAWSLLPGARFTVVRASASLDVGWRPDIVDM
jgi:hypothetical protein